MSRRRKRVLPFTKNPVEPKEKTSLNFLNIVKISKKSTMDIIRKDTGLALEDIRKYLGTCLEKDLVEINTFDDNEQVKLKSGSPNFIGVGFGEKHCFITLIDPLGNVLDSEMLPITPLTRYRGKKKEILELLDVIKQNSKLRGSSISRCGVAVPQNLISLKEKNLLVLAEGIAHIFNSDVFYCNNVVATGYGEREHSLGSMGENVIYLHSDVGSGLVLKGEMFLEPEDENYCEGSSYLRSWEQFGIVKIAKVLVNKGVGSSLVKLVNGDINNVTLALVLKAAEDNDELAKDLVVRSALALGVRVAYLSNIFNIRSIILGGGTGDEKGTFAKFVKESANKFLKKELVGNVNISGGELGEKAASLGAAKLCVRELFLEV